MIRFQDTVDVNPGDILFNKHHVFDVYGNYVSHSYDACDKPTAHPVFVAAVHWYDAPRWSYVFYERVGLFVITERYIGPGWMYRDGSRDGPCFDYSWGNDFGGDAWTKYNDEEGP